MYEFWQDPNSKRYLFKDTYDIDSTILRFKNWFDIEHELSLDRFYGYITPIGDGGYEEEKISEEDYTNNQEDSDYLSHVNYNALVNRQDYFEISKEFETIINDLFIHEEQNLFLGHAQKSINQAETDGQSKILLKSILQTLKTYAETQKSLKNEGGLNELQLIITEAYSSNYLDTLKILVSQYEDIFEQITTPFKELKPETHEPETAKPNKYGHIFIGNAFEIWQYMFESFAIKSSSRTDFKFMFEVMKKDKLIHETVSQTAMLNWVDKTYGIIIEKINPKDFKNDTKRMNVYSDAKNLYSAQSI